MSLRIYIGLLIMIVVCTSTQAASTRSDNPIANGGIVLSMENYGFTAVVLIYVKGKVVKYCGGTILSKYHVLTTATCFRKDVVNMVYQIRLRVGSVNIMKGGAIYNVSRVDEHPEYYTAVSSHNLALLYIGAGIRIMERAIEVRDNGLHFKSFISPGKINHNFIVGGEEALVVGFSESAILTPNSNMQDMSTEAISGFRCLDYYYRDTNIDIELVDDEIMCLNKVRVAGYCDMLDGTPVIVDSKVAGLLCASPCSVPHAPLIFTRLGNSVMWVYKQINATQFKKTARCLGGKSDFP